MKKKFALSLILSSTLHADGQWKPEEFVHTLKEVETHNKIKALKTIEEAAQEEEQARKQEEKKRYEEEIEVQEQDQEQITEENAASLTEKEQIIDIYQMLEHIKQHILQLHPHDEKDIKAIACELIEMLEIIHTVSIKKTDARSIDFGAYDNWRDEEDKTKQIDEEDTRYPQDQEETQL